VFKLRDGDDVVMMVAGIFQIRFAICNEQSMRRRARAACACNHTNKARLERQ
jgi:hypothetical protein